MKIDLETARTVMNILTEVGFGGRRHTEEDAFAYLYNARTQLVLGASIQDAVEYAEDMWAEREGVE